MCAWWSKADANSLADIFFKAAFQRQNLDWKIYICLTFRHGRVAQTVSITRCGGGGVVQMGN